MHTDETATLCHIPDLLKAIQLLWMSYDLHFLRNNYEKNLNIQM